MSVRLIEVLMCDECPYRRYDNGGGFTEPWHYCTHPQTKGKHIEVMDLRSSGNHDITYYNFPKWCELKRLTQLG